MKFHGLGFAPENASTTFFIKPDGKTRYELRCAQPASSPPISNRKSDPETLIYDKLTLIRLSPHKLKILTPNESLAPKIELINIEPQLKNLKP